MARSALAPQKVVASGLNATMSAANVDGHSVRSNGRTIIVVDNADASPMNVTLQTPGQIGGLDISEQVIAVPAGESRYIKLDKVHERLNRDVYVDFSSVTSLTIAALQI